ISVGKLANFAVTDTDLLDGELMEDSMPYKPAECRKEIAKHKKEIEKAAKLTTFKKTEKKKRMSFFTALSLSFKNLLTKKGRTIMVAFAGSIGIIGIALILAVSAGMTNYINSLQSQSLASYPVAVSAVNLDLENATALRDARGKNSSDDEIGVYNMKDTLGKFGKYNYITKDFITHATNYFNEPNKNNLLNELQVSYASDMHLITTMTVDGASTPIMYPINNQISFSALNGSTSATFFEGLSNTDYIRSVYNIYGTYPTAKDEIALVLNSSSVADYSVMSLGLKAPTKKADGTYETLKFQDIIDNKTYTLVYHDGYYVSDSQLVCPYFENFNITDLNPGSPKFEEAMTAQAQMAGMVADTEHTLKLKVTAVLTLKDDASGSIFNDGFMYTPALAEDYRNNCKNSNVVNLVKTNYSSSAAGDIPFAKPFTLRIAEIGTFSTILGGIDPGFFTYETPNSMIAALHDYFNIDVTYEQVMDIYMQVYGASDVPTTVQFYANSFEGKDAVVDMIKKWNAKPGVYSINYTDSSSMLTNMLGNIVNIISYVLIAFAAISLVVSSIMISIITYTSVIERTKEIGVLRSVGASKRDVSRVFNAETIIIGLLAGLIGVGVSWLLTLPIGLILKSLTGVAGLVVLQPLPAVLLVVVSTVLTFVAGLVPASIAAKKDPVLALRTE
ncbi:MAG: ABC transporter permease, partial [Clostridia bacterium]|nr:ABC transporter permease [Clostridia bacterium]